jgi:alpha-tubulin suppressor-like RCC1 family protein
MDRIRRGGVCALLSALMLVPAGTAFAEADDDSGGHASYGWTGRAAVVHLGDRLGRVAARYDESPARLRDSLLHDSTLHVDESDSLYYVDPAPSPRPNVAGLAPAVPPPLQFPVEQTFVLHSRPGSLRTIYLDFDGEFVTGEHWTNQLDGVCYGDPYDFDGLPNSFSSGERAAIQNAWMRVAEDYAPFNVDVTTQYPGNDKIDRASDTDLAYGTRVLITNASTVCPNGGTLTSMCPGPCGGIAFRGAFDEDGLSTPVSNNHADVQPAFVFTDGGNASFIKFVGEAASHETGHTLGLQHDGCSSCPTEYYGGAPPWAPIMGGSYYQPVTQWSKGEYALANNGEDDFAVMTSHGLARGDDHGDTTANATYLPFSDRTAAGLIDTRTDLDFFAFDVAAGSVTVSVSPSTVSPNLDTKLTLYNSSGTVLQTANPATIFIPENPDVAANMDASLTRTLAAGRYYFSVDGTGLGTPASGYSDYASVGRYRVAVVENTAPLPRLDVGSVSVVEGNAQARTVFFPATLSAPATQPVIVTYSVTPASASNTDFTPVTASATIPIGAIGTNVPVTINGDIVDEPDEWFDLSVDNLTGATLGSRPVTGTIIDDDPDAAIKVSIGDASIVEGNSGSPRTLNVPVTISQPLAQLTPVNWTVTGGSATVADGDFSPASGTVTLPKSGTGAQLQLSVNADVLVESDDTLTITLQPPTVACGCSLGRASGTATILTDDFTAQTMRAWGYNAGAALAQPNTPTDIIVSPRQVGINSTWTEVTAGDAFSVALRADGTIWTWGANAFGQLGDGTSVKRGTLQQIGTGFRSIAAGSHHVLGIKTDGTLWAWGDNRDGQLGIGTFGGIRTTPQQIGTEAGWTTVSAGGNSSFARRSGTLWGWGANQEGQLGSGNRVRRNAPAQVGTAVNWTTVVTSGSHTLAVQDNRRLFAWGDNTYGQLGDGTQTDRLTPKRIGTSSWSTQFAASDRATVATRSDGATFSWGSGSVGPDTSALQTTPALLARVVSGYTFGAFSSQGDHIVALRRPGPGVPGAMWAWGANAQGQLGDSTTFGSVAPEQIGASTWTRVAAGVTHGVAINGDGTLWVWGDNRDGVLGFEPTIRAVTGVPPISGPWLSVATGTRHGLGVKSDGSLWGWGDDTHGAVGRLKIDGGITMVSTPARIDPSNTWTSVAAGGETSFGIRKDGSLWAWGLNASGELGLGNSTTRYGPTRVGTALWRSVASSGSHTLAIKTNGSLWAWGLNASGQLGLNSVNDSLVPVRIGTATGWRSVSAGYGFSLAIKNNNTLWTWGSNQVGQLGDGTSVQRNTPGQIAGLYRSAAASGRHTLAIGTDGQLYGWGENTSGQVGNGTTSNQFNPVRALSTATNWKTLAAGTYHSAALKEDGTVWVYGDNTYGQLGDGTTTRRTSPRQLGLTNWATIAAGGYFTVALR